ncbi:formate/nitrite transporter family protein [Pelosinus sp. IPA-1]|uniref:formate/nitrite transporter family protein n=1 Tax=Pelosinus sp. IPA-1 TaxID=3029569 RepID=UPI0024362169|nr:formate/nitrite transporter family protein [Pelosinus sp. IPA-1]GMB00730.1 transporter [Pelosinus sp. IPA-1]
MYYEEINKLSTAAQGKSKFLKKSPLKYLLSAVLAGMYVGFGILLIFSIGGLLSQADSSAVRIIMGISFGIALSLVIMAGSELFTGNNMVMTIGNMEKKVTIRESMNIYLISFIGNLLGSVLISYLFVLSGLAQGSTAIFMAKVAHTKVTLPWSELFVRGILCNILVCLAIWCSFKMKEETGKLIMVFWCLFAFITTGFEHSVANMTLLSTVLIMPTLEGITVTGFLYNISFVTIGNFIGGALFVGLPYWYISQQE